MVLGYNLEMFYKQKLEKFLHKNSYCPSVVTYKVFNFLHHTSTHSSNHLNPSQLPVLHQNMKNSFGLGAVTRLALTYNSRILMFEALPHNRF